MTTITKASPFGPSILPANATTSHWQRTTNGDPLVRSGKHCKLPSSAEVVIIGGGLAGAVTAYSLLTSRHRPASVVVLEAREIGSGASGRNGGHCRPDAFRGFTSFSQLHGPEQAKKILESEVITMNKLASFVDKHKVDCELQLRPTVDVCLNDEFAEYNAQAYERAKAAGVDVSHVEYLDKEEVAKICQTPNAKSGWLWPAASVNPLKLTLGVYRQCQALGGFGLYSFAPVTEVVRDDKDVARPWAVVTTRGRVNAAKVVHATNAYSKLLLPELEGLVTPFRGQAARLSGPPNTAFPSLEPTMSLRRGLRHFYSVAPQLDDSVVLSCARTWAGQTPEDFEELWDTYDDSRAPPAQPHDTAGHVATNIPGAGWNAAAKGPAGLDSHWTGIVGFTPDAVPFIGPLPDKEGQYVIAGFNGHGMARIFHCAPCLADVVLGGMDKWDPTVPEVFQISPERLQRLRNVVQTLGDPTKQATAEIRKAKL